jgi:2-keto-4-pentenoate hydratase/2-oxohepta-3-ene-1,7-dioic acid hydratase in catechol pathway
MKLLRYGEPGNERPAILDPEGVIRDLGEYVSDIDGDALSPEGLARIAALDLASLPPVQGNPRIGPCIARPSKFICVGLNYSDHAAETGAPVPEEPILFMKATTAICGPYDMVTLPRGATKGDWEVELGVVIGKRTSYIDSADALDHVAGFCVVNDVSERAFQAERGGQWTKGKSADTFGPLGPWLVTKDEIGDVNSLDMFLRVNDVTMQQGNTRTMIFDVPFLVSYISQFMTLLPGDVIATGTPPGVGLGMKPPRFLVPGDLMHLGIAGLGEQRQRVCAVDHGHAPR